MACGTPSALSGIKTTNGIVVYDGFGFKPIGTITQAQVSGDLGTIKALTGF